MLRLPRSLQRASDMSFLRVEFTISSLSILSTACWDRDERRQKSRPPFAGLRDFEQADYAMRHSYRHPEVDHYLQLRGSVDVYGLVITLQVWFSRSLDRPLFSRD